MASRKEYEMLFKLNAQLGSGYTGTFGKAQKQLQDLQTELQTLRHKQADITAYQKQQKAVTDTSSKLELLKQQYENIRREYEQTGSSSSDLQNKMAAKQRQIDQTSRSLEEQNQKLNDMGTSLRAAGVDTNNLAQSSTELKQRMAEVREQEDEVAKSAEQMGGNSVSAITALSDALAAAGIAAALKEIAEAYKECVSIAGNFEEGMSNVEAISGATETELEALSEKAKELGATTKFTAEEATEAMGYMAMAGWSAEEMLSGMSGVMSLAAAAGEDLSTTSSIVADSLTAFGLSASDTTHFADVLAAAATNSNTNVSIMGETFKTAASAAGALGYSVEDVSVAVGLMANNGVKGTRAGTSLRNIFNGLLEGVTLTSEAFGEYEYTSVNTDGTMKSLSQTIGELRDKFGVMTDAEKELNAIEIAGLRGYNGLIAILEASDADYQQLTEDINNCSGAAERMANIKLDNMNGQLVIMKSAWDGLKITIGEEFTPAIEELYRDLTDVINWAREMLLEHPRLVASVTAFVGVIGAGVAGLTAFVTVTKVLIPLLATLTAEMSFISPVVAATVAVAALTAVIVDQTGRVKENIPEVRKMAEAARELKEAEDETRAGYELDEEALAAVVAVVGEAMAVQEEYAAQTREVNAAITNVTDKVDALAEAYTEAYEAAKESLEGQYALWDEADQVTATGADTLNKNLEGQTAYWESYNANLAALNEKTDDIEGLGEMIASFADGSPESVNAIAGMAQATDEQLTAMVENWTALQAAQDEAAATIAELSTDFADEMARLQEELAADIAALDFGSEAAEAGRDTIQGFIDGAEGKLPQVYAAYAKLGKAAARALSNGAGTYLPVTTNQYASGTGNAAAGLALVGENGPELVYLSGGETILTAAETAALQSRMQITALSPALMSAMSGGAVVNVAFNIEGNATPETVAALSSYGDDFASRVLAVLDEAGTDARRRGY